MYIQEYGHIISVHLYLYLCLMFASMSLNHIYTHNMRWVYHQSAEITVTSLLVFSIPWMIARAVQPASPGNLYNHKQKKFLSLFNMFSLEFPSKLQLLEEIQFHNGRGLQDTRFFLSVGMFQGSPDEGFNVVRYSTMFQFCTRKSKDPCSFTAAHERPLVWIKLVISPLWVQIFGIWVLAVLSETFVNPRGNCRKLSSKYNGPTGYPLKEWCRGRPSTTHVFGWIDSSRAAAMPNFCHEVWSLRAKASQWGSGHTNGQQQAAALVAYACLSALPTAKTTIATLNWPHCSRCKVKSDTPKTIQTI